MNAYELADILHQSDFLAMDFAEDAATMLRQQADTIYKHMELITELRKECNARADRIAELEKDLHMIERHYNNLDKDLLDYQKQAAELWNDSCTSNRSK